MNKSSNDIITLMYHRVDAVDTDPWGICVSPKHFEEQVQWLTNHYHVITVQDIINGAGMENKPKPRICITFDDGYTDNYIHAKSILEIWNCPATFFIATAFIGSSAPYWWDELEMILLHTKQLPAQLWMHIHGKNEYYNIDETKLAGKEWQHHAAWKWHEEPPTTRCSVFLSVWKTLRSLPIEDIKTQMNYIRSWANTENECFSKRLPMDEYQLRELSANPLFTIGLHTHTHPDLNVTEYNRQKEEIVNSKKMLNDQYHTNVSYLAYPYGSYNETTIQAAKECGIEAGFTTEMTTVHSNSDLLKLGRFQVGDWDADTFTTHLAEWMRL